MDLGENSKDKQDLLLGEPFWICLCGAPAPFLLGST